MRACAELVDTGTEHCSGRKAACAAVGGRLGFDVRARAVTAAGASTSTSGQTLRGDFRWIGLAHSDLLLDLLRMHHVALTWRIAWRRSLYNPRRRRPAVTSRWRVHVGVMRWRGPSHGAAHR